MEITMPEVAFKLGELPTKLSTEQIDETEDMFEAFPDGPLSPEELTFFANGGNPQDNPYRRDEQN